ncbi:MAG TPA: putative toxin-antitoxin system toxin component, PIN family [Rhodopila sp.]|nr:putative toxin-antitoxin system toxin component, PIN family [Rhodopila sp.]
MIVFDASAVVSAVLREDSVPERALLRAEEIDVFALSTEVETEIIEVLSRPRFAKAVSSARRTRILDLDTLRAQAAWFAPSPRVTDCRDAKDNKCLELAAASNASVIVSGDTDLLVLNPWPGVRILRPVDYLAEVGRG